MNNDVIGRLEEIGMARERLNLLLADEIWNDLSKHNIYWHAESEIDDEKLHNLRMKLIYVNEKLWEISEVLDWNAD